MITAATRDTPATVVTAALDHERLIPIVEQAFALLAAGFPAG